MSELCYSENVLQLIRRIGENFLPKASDLFVS